MTKVAENTKFFQLTNGRYIMDEEQSRKMAYIVSARPEQNYQSDTSNYAWDESGMAELFSECYQNDTRFCPETKCWFTYSQGAWRRDIGSLLVAEKIKEFYRLMTLYCGEIADDNRREKYLKFILKLGDRRVRDRLMKDAASIMPISAAEFDANPYLINCQNGTYDLEKMEFREHNWQDFLTMQTNFAYTLQETKCERWERFIAEITSNDTDKAEYLQKALGYSMLGTADEECMFVLHGKTTRNGKSTLLSTIHHLLGDYASVSPVSIICKAGQAKDSKAADPMLASLKGKRFVTMAESNQYGRLDEEAIKQMTGGEEIKARNLYETAITFKPQFTLWLSCNDLPSVNDKSLFASDRIRVIEFNRHFSPEEQDKSLKHEFQKQKNMQGIFAWLVIGYFKYKRFGLEMTEAMQKVVKSYEKDNDFVLQFLEERSKRAKDSVIVAMSLYNAYRMWCRANGYFTHNAKRFYADMETHPEWHSGKQMIDGVPSYKNIQLKGVK